MPYRVGLLSVFIEALRSLLSAVAVDTLGCSAANVMLAWSGSYPGVHALLGLSSCSGLAPMQRLWCGWSVFAVWLSEVFREVSERSKGIGRRGERRSLAA